jgi:hypothetical protein
MAKIDPLKNGFVINSYWGPRPETPAEIAARCQTLLNRLAAISPKFSGWNFVGRKPPPQCRQKGQMDSLAERYLGGSYTIAADHFSDATLIQLVEAGIHRDDDDVPDPEFGYTVSAFTRSRTDPDGLSLRVHAGCWIRAAFYTNTVHIETRPLCEENKAWLTLSVLEAAMLAVATTWDVTWGAVYPADLGELWTPAYIKRRPTFQMAWVTYLSPRFAPMVTPPSSAIVEYTPQGGIVMIATEERFDVANPAHVAAARKIEAALAPVNALPWPPDASPG